MDAMHVANFDFATGTCRHIQSAITFSGSGRWFVPLNVPYHTLSVIVLRFLVRSSQNCYMICCERFSILDFSFKVQHIHCLLSVNHIRFQPLMDRVVTQQQSDYQYASKDAIHLIPMR